MLSEKEVDKAARAAYARFMEVASHGKPLEPHERWEVIPIERQNDWRDAAEAAVEAVLAEREGTQKKVEEIQCPVCGYYCLGKGGLGCIDKPSLITSRKSDVQVPVVERMCYAYCMNNPATGVTADKQGMTAAYQVARAEIDKEWSQWGIVEVAVRNSSVAEYMKHWEERVTKAEANADFLRKSVGVCHLMISRNDLKELDGDWDTTDLPPRLKKYISDIDSKWEEAVRRAYVYAVSIDGSDYFMKEVRARLAQADKPRTKQERVEAILERLVTIPAGRTVLLSQIAAEIVAELERDNGK